MFIILKRVWYEVNALTLKPRDDNDFRCLFFKDVPECSKIFFTFVKKKLLKRRRGEGLNKHR